MPSPTLTVIMPNYNHANFLPTAIEAIVTQSLPPDEFIILDDGSTDNSVEIMENYAKRYSFIRVLKNERNIGVLKSVNRLFGEAKGDYIYCAAADDLVLPHFFEKAMEMAKTYPEAGIIFGDLEILHENGRILRQGFTRWQTELFASPAKYLEEVLFVEHPFFSNSQSSISKRELILEFGGYHEELMGFTDGFLIRAIGLKKGVCYFPQAVMRFRVLQDSYFHHVMLNRPILMMKIIFRTVALMKSPKFHHVFPKEYNIDFEMKAQIDIIRIQMIQWFKFLLKPTGIPKILSFLRKKWSS